MALMKGEGFRPLSFTISFEICLFIFWKSRRVEFELFVLIYVFSVSAVWYIEYFYWWCRKGVWSLHQHFCLNSFFPRTGHADVSHAVLERFPIIFMVYKVCVTSSACRRLRMVSMSGLWPDVGRMCRVRIGRFECVTLTRNNLGYPWLQDFYLWNAWIAMGQMLCVFFCNNDLGQFVRRQFV
jgi:hypothetical protein